MRILITGGSASGKSAFAEEQAVRLAQESGGALYYLAAMRDGGQEARARIERHRALRAGKGFRTIECPVRVDQADFSAAAIDGRNAASEKGKRGMAEPATQEKAAAARKEGGRPPCGQAKPVALLECLGNLLANEMYENGEKDLTGRILAQLDALSDRCGHLLVVTDEVFSDGETYDAWTQRYLCCLGELNRRLLEAFDAAAEVVFGVPVQLKRQEIPVLACGGQSTRLQAEEAAIEARPAADRGNSV